MFWFPLFFSSAVTRDFTWRVGFGKRKEIREIPIPDYVFEAILEQHRIYEKNCRRRSKEFRDGDYICCSTVLPEKREDKYYDYSDLKEIEVV